MRTADLKKHASLGNNYFGLLLLLFLLVLIHHLNYNHYPSHSHDKQISLDSIGKVRLIQSAPFSIIYWRFLLMMVKVFLKVKRWIDEGIKDCENNQSNSIMGGDGMT